MALEKHIPMDIVIASGESKYRELDFYIGSKALEGTAEAISLATNTILNNDVATKVPSIDGIMSSFMLSFEGSFGQAFMLKIVGDEQRARFEAIGESSFFQLLKYYLSKPMKQEFKFTTKKAMILCEELKDHESSLMKRIYGPLLKMHKPIEGQGYSVTLRKSGKRLLKYNSETLENLISENTDAGRVVIDASITRFNRLTGTGRLILEEDSESVSFEPSFPWKSFPKDQKKKLSKNLDDNNESDDFSKVKMEASVIRNYLGEIKRYSIHRVILDE